MIALVVMVLMHDRQSVFFIILVYLALATLVLPSTPRFVVKNLLAFGGFIVFPYLCALTFAGCMHLLVLHTFGWSQIFTPQIATRLLKIFLVWYSLNLYFFTTPLDTLLSLLDQSLRPLRRVGVSATHTLIILKCVLLEIQHSLDAFQRNMLAQAREIFRATEHSFKTKLQHIAGSIAGLLADSLQKVNEIQDLLQQTRIENDYALKITGKEVLSILSVGLLFCCICFFES
jgi:energy-coupling factor transporter transmembrane protein EcfT